MSGVQGVGQNHMIHIVDETVNSYHCVLLTLTTFFRGVTKEEKTLWLIHAGQCHGAHSGLLTDCPGRGIQEMAGVSQIVTS
jgi:hypothetical protein